MKSYIVFVLLFFSCSCKAQSDNNSIILQKALNGPKVLKYFHPEMNSRNPYYLLENKFTKKKTSLKIDGIPVIISQKKDVPNDNYIKILKLKVNNNQANLNFYYKIENAEIIVTLKKTGKNWQIEDQRVIEL